MKFDLKRRKKIQFCSYLVIVSAVALILLSSAAFADQLKIGKVDTSDFPEIGITFNLLNKDQSIDRKAITLRENEADIKDYQLKILSEEAEPSSVVLIIDSSGSMTGLPLELAKEAAAVFISQMNNKDRVSIVSFNSDPLIVSNFSSDKNSLKQSLSLIKAGGSTAVNDAVSKSLEIILKEKTNQKNIILLSDGADTASKITENEMLNQVSNSKVPIYAVALQSGEFDASGISKISERSGGNFIIAPNAQSLITFYDQLAKEFKNQYLVTYESLNRNEEYIDINLAIGSGNELVSDSTQMRLESNLISEEIVEEVTASSKTAIFNYGLPFILILSFIAAAFLSIAIENLFLSEKNILKDQMKIHDRINKTKKSTTEETKNIRLLDKILDVVGYLAAKRGFTDYGNLVLEQAGLPIKPREYIFFHFIIVLGTGLFVLLTVGSLFTAMLFVIAAVVLPLFIIKFLVDRRQRTFYDQLPEILSMLSGSLKAGYGLLQAVDLVSKEAEPPMSLEFKRVLQQTQLGVSLDEALSKMAERVRNESFYWTVLAINIQKESGGNLAEILDTLADTIRQRETVKRHIKGLTAEGRLSAVILYALPFIQGAAMFYINPTYMSLLFTNILGWGMIIMAALMMIVGAIWLKSIISIEV